MGSKGINICDCDIQMIVDTQEKEWFHIANVWDIKKVKYKKRHIKTGDYSIEIKTSKGEVINFEDKIVIERKACLTELCGNLTDNRDSSGKNRFIRELERAKKDGMKLILLIEDADGYDKALKGFFREDKPSRMNSNGFIGMLMAYKARYDFEIVWLDKSLSASYIYKLLYYEAREYLKNMNEI